MSGTEPTLKPRLAYLTTSYPNVSHTFIRREILALESLGYQVYRVAIRRGEALVDEIDRQEQTKTLHLLDQPAALLLWRVLRGLLSARWRAGVGLAVTLRLSRRSERGLLRHFAYLFEALALLSFFRDEHVDHVHVHFGTNAAAVAMLVRLLGGPPYSMMIHGPDEFDAPIGLSLGLKMEHAEFTTAISNFCASQLRRWVAYPEWRKIHVIRCCVDEGLFQAATPVEQTARTLVSVARLSAQKGHLFLIDAFAEAVAQGLQSRLLLIGDGEFRRPIEQRIRDHGLDQRVELLGWVDSNGIRRHLQACRALVLPSFAEGLPVVLMEAMALARPVLTTSIAGVPELVTNEESGWLVVAGDREQLREALLAVDRAPVARLTEMGQHGLARVRQQHHISAEAEKLDRLFLQHAKRVPANAQA